MSAYQHVAKSHKGVHREDMAKFLAAVRSDEDKRPHKTGRTNSSYILEFAALTSVRVGEIIQATWNEIDLPNRKWTVPWQHLKVGKRHRMDRPVPITQSMVRILEERLSRINSPRKEDLVFPNEDRGGTVYSNGAITDVLEKICLRIDIPVPTIHGFRTTLRGWGKNSREPHYPHLVEIQLDHKVAAIPGMRPTKVDDAYDGQDDDWGLRVKMMEAYDAFCSRREPPGDNVLQFSIAK
jgi:integrase